MGEFLWKATQEDEPDGAQYNASLSTMWAMQNYPDLGDFVTAAWELGFSHIELSHQITSAMLKGLAKFPISSVHEPCPADISTDELKQQDWLISALDEDRRRRGVEVIRRSISLAAALGARLVVVHAGSVQLDRDGEHRLRQLYHAGQAQSDEFQRIKQQLIQDRAPLAGARFEAVRKSLAELLQYAEKLAIRLGIENRSHYMEIPTPDELDVLLSMAGPEQLGFVYDVGHAEALSRLGFYPYETWLKRFAPRIVGTHLHDVVGLSDHYSPGRGEVNFRKLAAYLPDEAVRTCEVQGFNTPRQIKNGMKYLVDAGCVSLRPLASN